MGTEQSRTKEKQPPPSPSYRSLPEDWPWVWGMRDSEHLDWKLGLSDDEILARASLQRDLPVPITDGVVYLGDARSVASASKLEARGITAVLNMAGPYALPRKTVREYGRRGIRYKRIDAHDETDYELLRNDWVEAREFIRASTSEGGGKCVVHCVAGMNRSGLVVSAYHMTTTRTNVLDTVKHVRTQRGNVALCNEGFQRQLVALARAEDLLGPAPGTDGSVVREAPPPSASDWISASMARRREDPLDCLDQLTQR